MFTVPRRLLAAAALVLVAIGIGGAATAASPATTPAEPVASRTVATVEVDGTAGLARGLAIRVAGRDDVARLDRILGEAPADGPTTTTPAEPPTARVLQAVIDALPPTGTDDSVVLVGLVEGCSPRPGLVRLSDGEVVMVDVGSDPHVACAVSRTIVGVVEAAADDVPVGGADRATLQHFGFVGHEPILPEHHADLPPVADDHERITAVVAGCQSTTAELVVSATRVEAVAAREHGEPEIACVRPEYFVAVFDIAAALIPDTAQVATHAVAGERATTSTAIEDRGERE